MRSVIVTAAVACAALAACGDGEPRSSLEVEEVLANETPRVPRPPSSPVPEPATVAEAARAAQRTHEVTRALMAETTLDATWIDVVTHEAGRTVYLRGLVPSTLQRDLAARLAHAHAAGYDVRNELVVGP